MCARLRGARTDAFAACVVIRLDIEGDERRRAGPPEAAREVKARFAETKKSNRRPPIAHAHAPAREGRVVLAGAYNSRWPSFQR
jgi:hypothetical protein